MNSADIFDEYFDDEKPKYIIKNYPAYSKTQGVYWTCYENNNKLLCQDCTDCILKKIYKNLKQVAISW